MRKSDFYLGDLLFIVLLGLVTLACGWVYRDFAQDDAFITYRYARNIAKGYGFVYNLGEPVLGTTSPLYTLWLAFLGRLSGEDIRLISHWSSIFSLWLAGIVLHFLGRRNGVLRAGAISLVFVTNPLLAWSVGMETCFLNLFVLLVLIAYRRNKLSLTGVLLGILVLIRLETVLLAFILAGHHLLKHRKIPWRLAAGLPLFSAWAVFAWGAFGSVVPQSASAKLVSERVPFILGTLIYWRLFANHNAFWLLVIPLIALGGYSAVRFQDHGLGFFLILVWSIVYFFAAGLVAGAFPWYYGPLVPAFAILAVWGSDLLVRLPAPLFEYPRTSERRKRATHSVLLVFVTLALVALQVDSWGTVGTVHLGRRVDPRYTIYREVANWLNQHAQESDTLATPEIGVLGYYTDMRIIDLYGLVTPSLTPRQGEDIQCNLERAIALYAPDYVVTDEHGLIEHLQRSSRYRLVRRFGDGAYTLYEDSRY